MRCQVLGGACVRGGDECSNDRHCQEMRVPVQADSKKAITYPAPAVAAPFHGEPGIIRWWEHVEAWIGYARKYGTEQSAERIMERGGFGYQELVDYLGHEPTTWEPR